MKKLYIIRGIKVGQYCHDADIGMNNILAMGKYANVENAKRFMKWNEHESRCWQQGYSRIALFDLHGVICASQSNKDQFLSFVPIAE